MRHRTQHAEASGERMSSSRIRVQFREDEIIFPPWTIGEWFLMALVTLFASMVILPLMGSVPLLIYLLYWGERSQFILNLLMAGTISALTICLVHDLCKGKCVLMNWHGGTFLYAMGVCLTSGAVLLNILVLGRARDVLRRVKADGRWILKFERRWPFGWTQRKFTAPLDCIGPIHIYREQRSWGEFPASSVVFGQDGHQHSLPGSENAVLTEVVKTLRRWQRAAQGAPAGLKAELSFSPEGKTRLTSAAAFSPGVRLLASGGFDGMIRVRTWPDGHLIDTLEIPTPTYSGSSGHAFALAVSPDGDRLVYHGFHGEVQLWGLADKMQLAALGQVGISTHNTVHGLQSVAFSPDGNTFALAGPEKQVSLWESTAGKQLGTFEKHWEKVWSVAFSPDGRAIASGGRSVLLWEVSSRKLICALKGHAATVNSLGISPDGKTIASASWDGTIRLWSVPEGKPLASIDCGNTGEYVATPLAFSCDGKTLAWGDLVRGGVRLWSVQEGKPLATFDGHCSHVLAVAFAADGKTLVSAAHDDTVIAWRIPEGH